MLPCRLRPGLVRTAPAILSVVNLNGANWEKDGFHRFAGSGIRIIGGNLFRILCGELRITA